MPSDIALSAVALNVNIEHAFPPHAARAEPRSGCVRDAVGGFIEDKEIENRSRSVTTEKPVLAVYREENGELEFVVNAGSLTGDEYTAIVAAVVQAAARAFKAPLQEFRRVVDMKLDVLGKV